MSYLVFARKYRPGAFDTVSGQQFVTQTLKNAIIRNKIAHAYIFSGPRGVGKTSIARIFAKCLNCINGPTVEPCLKCSNCKDIANSSSLSVREIDGASHNSVDNIRELIESFRSLPPPGSKFKVYIIDEVHMLSTSAFNALLKSLEEPPSNTVFILATTEIHKIPDTVLSRCQKFELKALGLEEIIEQLKKIAEGENLNVDTEVFSIIARLSEGSMRDAQSLFERVTSFSNDKDIKTKDVVNILGAVEQELLFNLSKSIFENNPSVALKDLNEGFSSGIDINLFLKDFVEHWRQILIAKFGNEELLKSKGVLIETINNLKLLVKNVSQNDIKSLTQLAIQGCNEALKSYYPKIYLESLVVRMSTRENVINISEVIKKLPDIVRNGSLKKQSDVTSKGGETDKSIPKSQISKINQNLDQEEKNDSELEKKKSLIPNQIFKEDLINENVFFENNEEETSKNNTNTVEIPDPDKNPDTNICNWETFVQYCTKTKHKILAEKLKRFNVIDFNKYTLNILGPAFNVDYFIDKNNQEKLENLLQEFFNENNKWHINFQVSEKGVEIVEGSLMQEEKKKKDQQKIDMQNDAECSPLFQSIKKVFPYSTIEYISLSSESKSD